MKICGAVSNSPGVGLSQVQFLISLTYESQSPTGGADSNPRFFGGYKPPHPHKESRPGVGLSKVQHFISFV